MISSIHSTILLLAARLRALLVIACGLAWACGTTHADPAGFAFTDRIHPDLPEMHFLLTAGARSADEAEGQPSDTTSANQGIQEIREIRIQQDGRTVQTIANFAARPIIDEDELDGFVIEDLNFDGYKDLRLIEFLPAGPNIPYLVWLYQPEQKRFVASDLFAEITSPEVNAEKRQIKMQWRDGAAKYGTDIYEFRRGALIMVRQITKEYLNESRYRLIVRELQDVELVEVENRIVDADPESE